MAKDREDIQSLIDDEAFIDDLSRGVDPSSGSDPLAALLLELRADVEAPMPQAPLVDPVVIDLRHERARRRPQRWIHGLVGFAAGVILVAGSGVVISTAGPASPLYGARTALFGPDNAPQVVELAGTLDELEDRTEKGDFSGAKELIDKARKQLDKANNSGPAVIKTTAVRTETLTVTATPPTPAPSSPVVTTVFVTPSPVAPPPSSPLETTEAEPTPATTVVPTVTTTPEPTPPAPVTTPTAPVPTP